MIPTEVLLAIQALQERIAALERGDRDMRGYRVVGAADAIYGDHYVTLRQLLDAANRAEFQQIIRQVSETVTVGPWARGAFIFPTNSGDSVQLPSPGALVLLGATYTPSQGGQSFRVFSPSSTAIAATNEDLRELCMWNFFDTKTDDVNNAIIVMDMVQRTNPGAATIKKTALHIKAYTQPDNGGDTSGLLCVQTGGGTGIACYKLSETHRPTGYTNYWDSPQGAAEFGTNDGAHGVLGIAGYADTSSRISVAIIGRCDNSVSSAFLATVADGILDSRIAYAVGGRTGNNNGAITSQTFQVLMSGHTDVGGSEANNTVGSGDKAALKIMNQNAGAAGRVAELQFGIGLTSKYAAISGVLADGSSNTAGHIAFSTRGAVADATTTERVRIKNSGSVTINTDGLATGATTGDLYIPSCAGTPSGTPTAEGNSIAVRADRSNNILYFYSGGAWQSTQGAPIAAQYVTLATNATLTNERVLTAGTGISLTDGGAGSTITVANTGNRLLSSSYTDVGNVGAGADDLHTYSMPGATLGTDGHSVRITAFGTFAANGNNKQVVLKFGATTLIQCNNAAHNGGTWYIEATVIRTGATTQRAIGTFELYDGAGASTHFQTYATPGETLSGAVTIKTTGEAVSDNDIIAKGFVVEKISA